MVYIGDISHEDYLVLRKLAEESKNILEFGVGASTQVISRYSNGEFTTIDTSSEWIEKTKANILQLGFNIYPEFSLYDDFKPSGKYNFVFNDGVDNLRLSFALMIWDYIPPGGVIAFHDTRRPNDVANVTALINAKFNEIDKIEMNKNHSNITLIHKKEPEPYKDWNITEGRVNFKPKGYE